MNHIHFDFLIDLTDKELDWWNRFTGEEIKFSYDGGEDPPRSRLVHISLSTDLNQVNIGDEPRAAVDVDLDYVAQIIRRFLADTGSDKTVSFEWSRTTGNTDAVDEVYGGGAVLIGKRGYIIMNTTKWLEDVRQFLPQSVESSDGHPVCDGAAKVVYDTSRGDPLA